MAVYERIARAHTYIRTLDRIQTAEERSRDSLEIDHAFDFSLPLLDHLYLPLILYLFSSFYRSFPFDHSTNSILLRAS